MAESELMGKEEMAELGSQLDEARYNIEKVKTQMEFLQGKAERGTLKDGFTHELPGQGETNDWITPKWIVDALGGVEFFDLDPCSSVTQPWVIARKAFTVEQNGLLHDWWGNIYLNPPYGPNTEVWIKRLVKQLKQKNIDGGIALIFARVETKLWQEEIFPTADGFLFPNHRISFARPNGTTPKGGSAGTASALIAWGEKNRAKLIQVVEDGTIPGAFLDRAFYTGSEGPRGDVA